MLGQPYPDVFMPALGAQIIGVPRVEIDFYPGKLPQGLPIIEAICEIPCVIEVIGQRQTTKNQTRFEAQRFRREDLIVLIGAVSSQAHVIYVPANDMSKSIWPGVFHCRRVSVGLRVANCDDVCCCGYFSIAK